MSKFIRFPLRVGHRRIFYNQYELRKDKKAIMAFLENADFMHNIDFAKEAMTYFEIKSNNSIEGLNDDIQTIEQVVNQSEELPYWMKERIINLHKGYDYILNNHNIDKETLKELYGILSKDLLDEYSLTHMGNYYRKGPVYVSKDRLLDIRKQGMPHETLDKHMDNLLDYIKTDTETNEIDNFIKSQIIHFYFVYVHPYFDVNGRCGRTLAMWHLLNNEAYPYIVFNRAISVNKSYYEKRMSNVTSNRVVNLTKFLKYIIRETHKELERQLLITNIKEKTPLNISEQQFLEYILSVKDDITISNVTRKYNAYNIYKSEDQIWDEYIYPLILSKVLVFENNHIAINDDILDINPKVIKRLEYKKITR